MIIVIGAGIAGLNAALTCQRAGREILLLEASDRGGGRIKTDFISGYQLDHGFQVINPAYPEVKKLNLQLQLQNMEAGVKVATTGKNFIVADPFRSPKNLFSTLRAPIGSIKSKSSLITYLLKKPLDGTANFEAELNTYGINGPLYEKVIRPFMRGVLLGELDLVDAKVGKELLSFFAKGTPGIPLGGSHSLPDLMAKQIDKLNLNESVVSVNGKVVTTDQRTYTAEKIIVAIDGANATNLIPEVTPPRFNLSTTWYFATAEKVLHDKFLMVDGENRGPIVNLIALDQICSSFAPLNMQLLSLTTLIPRAAITADGFPSPAITPSTTWRANLSVKSPALTRATISATSVAEIGRSLIATSFSLAIREISPNHQLRALAGSAPSATVASTTSNTSALIIADISLSGTAHCSCKRLRWMDGRSGKAARSCSIHAASGATGTKSGSGK